MKMNGIHEKLELEVKEDTDNNEEERDSLDMVLQHLGEMGTYQKFLFVSMLPFGLFISFVYFVQMFIAATPQHHWCMVPELQHLDMELRRNLTAPGAASGDWDRCFTFSANWSQVLETLQPPDPDTPLVPCQHGWEFQLGDIPYHTVVSERGWVCKNAKFVPTAQSVFFVGSLIGGLFFGWFADRYGRVPTLVGSNLIACFGGIASIFTTGFLDFTFCRFLVGMSYDTNFMILYILVLEYVGPSQRTWVGNMATALFYGSGCLVLPALAVRLADWRTLLWATSLPMLVVLATPYLIPESARWLSSRGRCNDAVKVLKRFEKINGNKIPQDVLDEFIVTSNQTRETDESITALFRSSALRSMLFYMTVVYMSCALIFDGLVRMSESLGFDFFVTFTLTSATEIPSLTLLVFVLDRWGRRILTCVPLAIAGIFALIAAFLPKGLLQVALAIMARFCMNMSCAAVVQWSAELLPTPVRASGCSMVHASGYVATFMSPFVIYLERTWQPLPLLMLGALALVAAAKGLLLPETNGRSMPQTVADGERLFRETSLFRKLRNHEDDTEAKQPNKKALIT